MTTNALVLGGGGVTGTAWELGLLFGLAEAGVDVTDADTVIGTSAGSVVAAQITAGTPLEQSYGTQLAPATGEIGAKLGLRFNLLTASTMLRSNDPRQFRRRIGARALRAKTISQEARRTVVAGRLPVDQWPARRVRIVAVDAETGDDVVFDSDSGVHLVDAVVASCAVPTVWPPARIGDRRFIDGGLRSWTNADLADGADPIVVLAPMPQGGGAMPTAADQVRELARRATVALIMPDGAALRAMGSNILDPSRRAASAQAGRRQAGGVAATVRAAWTEPQA